MKSHAQDRNHQVQAPGNRGSSPLHRGPFALLATLATILAIVELTSCAGYTANAQPPGGQPQGPGAGVLTASSTTLSFGTVPVGNTATQNLTVTNTGTATVNISQVTITGAAFTVIGGNPATSIAVGNSSTVQVQFAPTSASAATGTLTVTSDASNSPLSVSMNGTGTQSDLSITPPSVSFGNVNVGQSGTQNITLTNTGTASIMVSAATASGSGFSISGLPIPTTINAGLSAIFTATFTPASSGTVNGSVTITSTAPGSPVSISLSGTGIQPQLSANPTSASFGNVVTGVSNSLPITLTNGGTASVTISQANVTGTGFSITGLTVPATINAGNNTSFNVVFAPTSSGAVTGSVSLVSNAPNSPLAISLSGTGVAATHLLTANPTSLSFGNVGVSSSSALPVTLTNSGNSNVTISNVTASGAGFSVMGVSSGLVLTPNQQAALSVTFAPTSGGSVTGSLSVTSTATNSPATVSLSGTGVQSHSVGLTWTDSSSSGVAGYNVYRGTTSGTYSKITGSPVSGSAYTDSAVQSGQNITYFYVVTAVDSTGVESTNSNQAVATVP